MQEEASSKNNAKVIDRFIIPSVSPCFCRGPGAGCPIYAHCAWVGSELHNLHNQPLEIPLVELAQRRLGNVLLS
jgi:hypothetical protein